MANTYTQIHIHVVFAVRGRENLIDNQWKDELYKYITGIIKNNKHKVLQINGMPDHIHILIGMRPTQSLSDLVKLIKGKSSQWINENRYVKGNFSWQSGFGAFAYSKSHIPVVIEYIKNQEKHHNKKTFREEYIALLEEFEVEYDKKFIFDEVW